MPVEGADLFFDILRSLAGQSRRRRKSLRRVGSVAPGAILGKRFVRKNPTGRRLRQKRSSGTEKQRQGRNSRADVLHDPSSLARGAFIKAKASSVERFT